MGESGAGRERPKQAQSGEAAGGEPGILNLDSSFTRRAPSSPRAAGNPAAGARPKPAGKPAPSGASPKQPAAGKDGGDETPYLREIQEVFRLLVIAEKTSGLYPAHSKVVKESTSKLFAGTKRCLELVGPLRVQLTAESFVHDGEVIYSEEEKSKSLAFRIHRDGVREITILPDVTEDEIHSLVICLKEARKADEDDDDFITLFWERDCTHIQVQLADDFVLDDEAPPIPEERADLQRLQIQRFKIPKEEEERLKHILERRQEEDEGDETFVISETEAQGIRELVRNESSYFPLFDFVDILLEVMIRNPDPGAFERSVKMLRSIIAAVIEDLDFERAAHLLKKLSTEEHPGLTEAHVRQIREMLETFTDKGTLALVESYLAESDKLPANHPIFRFLMAFPRSAAEALCQFLRFRQHVQAISQVLVHLGTGNAAELARHLDDPDPLLVRALIGVILQAEKGTPVKHIARALKHKDEGVRAHAARAILDSGDASAAPMLLPLLEEQSKQLLNLGLQFFSKFSCPESYSKLEALIRGRSFFLLDQKRQLLCFKALIKASYSHAIEFVSGRVLRWRLCLTQESADRKAAALLSLGSTDSDEARAILERFAQRKRGRLAPSAQRALKEMEDRARKGTQCTAPAPDVPASSAPEKSSTHSPAAEVASA